MKRETSIWIAALVFCVASADAADRHLAINDGGPDSTPTVGLFRAIDADQVGVRFIPLDAAEANVLIANKTERVLHVRLPEAFAAVPVLGQFGQQFGQGGQGAGAGLFGGGGGGGASQGVGGNFGGEGGGGQGFGNAGFGMNGMGNGFMGGGGGRRNGIGQGFMRIPPGKSRKIKAVTVCLEHGKAEPNPRMKYRIIPVDRFTNDQRVAKLCARVGRDGVTQNIAQAAAWHLANDLSWNRLEKLNRVESRYLGNVKFFNKGELDDAKQLVAALFPRENESYPENDESYPTESK